MTLFIKKKKKTKYVEEGVDMQVSRSEEPALRRAWVGLGYGIVLVGHGWMKWDIIAQQHWTLVLLLGVVFWGIP
jgi:hypothetical protein